MTKNESAPDGASRMQKVREKLVGWIACLKTVTEKYILRWLVLVAAVIVLLSGFFVKYEYIPIDEVQTYQTSVSDNADITDILSEKFSDTRFEQSMFYPLSALAVGDDREANATEFSDTSELMLNATNAFISEKSDIIMKLGLMLATTDYDADEVMKLIDELGVGASSVYADINLMRYEKLEAKEAYMNALDVSAQGSGVELFERRLDDLTVRDAVLSVGSIIYIYLQAVAVIFIVLEVLALVRRKTGGAKFFAFYIPGIFALFAVSQLTAVGVSAAAVACCAVAVVFCALYALGKIWVTSEGTAARGGLVGLFGSLCLLISACLFGSPMYSFGVRADNIGAALGFNCYNNHVFAEGELNSAILINYLPLAVFHIVALTLTLISLVRLTVSSTGGKKCGWKLPAVAAGVTLAGYIVYKICVLCSAVDLVALGGQMLVIVVLNTVAAIAAYISSADRPGKQEEAAVEQTPAEQTAQTETE